MIKVTLKETLKRKNTKITELAEMTGLHRNSINKILKGTTGEGNDGIKFETLDKICRALDCSVSDVIEYVNEESTAKN